MQYNGGECSKWKGVREKSHELTPWVARQRYGGLLQYKGGECSKWKGVREKSH